MNYICFLFVLHWFSPFLKFESLPSENPRCAPSLLCSGNINSKEYYMVKQILHGNMSSYFYVDSIATMLPASPDNGVTA